MLNIRLWKEINIVNIGRKVWKKAIISDDNHKLADSMEKLKEIAMLEVPLPVKKDMCQYCINEAQSVSECVVCSEKELDELISRYELMVASALTSTNTYEITSVFDDMLSFKYNIFSFLGEHRMHRTINLMEPVFEFIENRINAKASLKR